MKTTTQMTLFAVACLIAATLSAPTFSSNSKTVQNSQVEIQWEVFDSTQKIMFRMSMKTTGWISVGLNTKNSMKNADCYTGFVDNNNKPTLIDTFSPNYNMPFEDTARGGKSDVHLLASSQTNGWTTLTFERSLKTNDQWDFDIVDKQIYLVWAYANTDNLQKIHVKDGGFSVNLISGVQVGSGFSPDLFVLVALGAFSLAFFAVRLVRLLRQKKRAKKHQEEWSNNQNVLNESSSTPEMFKDSKVVENPFADTKRNMDQDDEISYVNEMPNGHKWYEGSSVMTEPRKKKKSKEPKVQIQVEETPNEQSKPENGNRCWNCLKGSIFYKRVPYLNAPFFLVLCFALYVLVNIAGLFVADITEGAISVGALCAVNFLFATLPATKNSLLSFTFGVSFIKTLTMHRWIGNFAFLLAVVHTIWVIIQRSVDSGFSSLLTIENLFGVLALIAMLVLFVLSFEFIRRKNFQAFFFPHICGFLLLLVFGSLHNPSRFLFYAIVAAAFYVIDHSLRFLWGGFPQKTKELEIKSESTIQISFKKSFWAKMFGRYRAGAYVFVNFPQISPLQWHPFSLSSGPFQEKAEICIKGAGDHTKTLVEKVKLCKDSGIWIRVEGPYGQIPIQARRFPFHLLVAGGIGITPLLSLLKDVFEWTEGCMQKSFVTQKKPEKAHVIEKIVLVWIVKHFSEFLGFRKELESLLQISKQQGENWPKLEIKIFLTKENEMPNQNMDPSIDFSLSKPSSQEIFQKVEEEVDSDQMKKPLSVVVCGPRSLTLKTWKKAHSLQLSKGGKRKVEFHAEMFEM